VRRKDGKWFLLVTVDRPDGTKTPPTDVPGVGLGVGNIATDSDGQRHSGAHIEECRLRHHNKHRQPAGNGAAGAPGVFGASSNPLRGAKRAFAMPVAKAKGAGRGLAPKELSVFIWRKP
jgi:hypothetical protein